MEYVGEVIDTSEKNKRFADSSKKGIFICHTQLCLLRDVAPQFTDLFCRFCVYCYFIMYSKGDRAFYFVKLTEKLFIDSRKYGNKSRYINHSCEPNTRLEKWIVPCDGEEHMRLGFFTIKDIFSVKNYLFLKVKSKRTEKNIIKYVFSGHRN